MKAAVLYKKHDLRIENLPMPVPAGNQVLIKTAFCGVCGTDVHLFNGDEGSVKMTPMTIPGHELSGINMLTNEKVVVDPNYYCGKCEECLAGRPHYCRNMKNTGVNSNGGFADYLVAEQSQIHVLPTGITLEEACFLEPISCCLHGLNKIMIDKNDHVLIIGGGTIGLLMLQLSIFLGASRTAVVELVNSKRDLALVLGADEVYEDVSEIRNHKFNKVIECIGLKKTCEDAISICANTGHVLLFGLTEPEETISIRPFDLFKRDLTVTSSYINPYTIEEAIKVMSTGKIRTAPLIGQILPLENLEEVLKDSKLRQDGKVLIKLN
ncbi:MAG: alcohol dehydrogenase catalytic domain-containing protein [Clostridia bacterium]|nr:alcohol dehydrogenase catalytic domain-containing protein [Clostridia bacterium]